MYTEEIANLLVEKFREEDFLDCFLVAIEQQGKTTGVFLDSDSGISLEKCQKISRFLESHIEENRWFGEDYVLEVSSPGLTRPLVFPRQYKKNMGRELTVELKDGETRVGNLVAATDKNITLQFEEIRKEGKKKITETKEIEMEYSAIKEAKINIKI